MKNCFESCLCFVRLKHCCESILWSIWLKKKCCESILCSVPVDMTLDASSLCVPLRFKHEQVQCLVVKKYTAFLTLMLTEWLGLMCLMRYMMFCTVYTQCDIKRQQARFPWSHGPRPVSAVLQHLPGAAESGLQARENQRYSRYSVLCYKCTVYSVEFENMLSSGSSLSVLEGGLLTYFGSCQPVPLCTAGPHPPHRTH